MKRALISFAVLVMVACVAIVILRPIALISALGEWKTCSCRYQHVETTGLMDKVVLADGASAIIRFTPDSDATALAALNHITRGMIFGTSDDKRTIGSFPFRQCITLHGDISRIRSNGFLYGDDYFWFRLSSWTLETPFDIQVSSEEGADGVPAIKSCNTFADAGVTDLTIDGKIVPLNPFLISRE